jgi:PKD repeat protein
MIDRRQLVVLATIVLAATLVTSSAGSSSIESDRNTQVAVADDSSALLGFNQTVSNTTNGTTTLTLTLTNQYPSGTSLTTVSVTAGGESVSLAENGSVAPGEQITATFDSVSCGSSIAVEASGGGVFVSLDRSVICNSA